MCEKHYRRMQRTGTLTVQIPRDHCNMQGCRALIQARGYCDKHYQIAKNHGIVQVTKKAPRPDVCDSCTKPLLSGKEDNRADRVPYKGHGLCRVCYAREWKTPSDIEVDPDILILFDRMKSSTGLTKKEIMRMLRVYGEE